MNTTTPQAEGIDTGKLVTALLFVALGMAIGYAVGKNDSVSVIRDVRTKKTTEVKPEVVSHVESAS